MRFTFIWSPQGQVESHSFGSRDEFIGSVYNNRFLDLDEHIVQKNGEETLDVSGYSWVRGQLTMIPSEDRKRFFSGDAERTFAESAVIYSSLQGRYILREYAIEVANTEEYASQAWLRESNDHTRNIYRQGGWWDINGGDVVYVEESGCYAHIDDACWDEDTEMYYIERHRRDRENITHYGGTRSMTRTLDRDAIAQIGYEVEKNRFTIRGSHVRRHGDHVGSFRLFRGYERDSSCGVEAITHVLPATPDKLEFVNELIDESEELLGSAANSRCGGHISVSYRDIPKRQLALLLKPAIPVLLSIWRERLVSGYGGGCGNPLVHESRLQHARHSVINCTRGNDTIELRLPPAVKNAKDLKFRHALMVEAINVTITTAGDLEGKQLWSRVKERLYPIVKEYYGDKAEERLELAEAFNTAMWMSEAELKDNCPASLEAYLSNYLSSARREAARIERQRLERERIRREQEAIIEGLRSTRRRARTVRMGEAFTVSCMIDGVRRSRTCRVTSSGVTWNRGELIYQINPNDIHGLTITDSNGVTITSWDEYRRGGETLHWIPRVERTREFTTVTVSRYTWNVRRVGDIAASGWGSDREYFVCYEGDTLEYTTTGGGNYRNDYTSTHYITHNYDWDRNRWTEVSRTPITETVS